MFSSRPLSRGICSACFPKACLPRKTKFTKFDEFLKTYKTLWNSRPKIICVRASLLIDGALLLTLSYFSIQNELKLKLCKSTEYANYLNPQQWWLTKGIRTTRAIPTIALGCTHFLVRNFSKKVLIW